MKSIPKILILTSVLILSACTQINSVTIDNQSFVVDLAVTSIERTKGLQAVENLQKNKGMLFISETPKVETFWMHKTLIPLDMIFIDENLEIINIEEAQPCTEQIAFNCERYQSKNNAKYVLEINGGLSDEYGFTPNSKVTLNLNGSN